MKWKHRKISLLLLRVVICFLLIGSGPGGMVLCIGADGHAELKPTFHSKEHHSHQSHSQCCCHHHQKQNIQPDENHNSTRNQMQPDNKYNMSCVDISVFDGYAEVTPPTDQIKPITHHAIVIIFDIALGIEAAEEILPSHPPGEIKPSLLSLRTVILLT
ncbi:hypothetical protein ACFL02_08805 [Planctomycetota bacterium]